MDRAEAEGGLESKNRPESAGISLLFDEESFAGGVSASQLPGPAPRAGGEHRRRAGAPRTAHRGRGVGRAWG